MRFTHCFEDDINPDTNPWIAEGQSEWVGEEVAGPSTIVSAQEWKQYLQHPEIPLFNRDYDAIGFYAHLNESCINPWMILDAMLRAAKGGDRKAYDAATSHCTSGSAEPFLDSWASGLFRDPSRSYEWDAPGPAIPDASLVHTAPHGIALSNGHSAPPVSAPPFTNGIYTLVSGADIVQVAATGHARLSDGNLDRVLRRTDQFCTRTGGCACPPGSGYQGPPLTPLAMHADLALTGGPEGTGTRVALAGLSLDTFCREEARAPATRSWWRSAQPLQARDAERCRAESSARIQRALTPPLVPLRIKMDLGASNSSRGRV